MRASASCGLGLLGDRARSPAASAQLGEPARAGSRCARRRAGRRASRSAASRAASARISSSRAVRARAQRLPLLVGGVLVVHGRVRRYEEDVAAAAVARVVGRRRGEQRGGRADGHGGTGQQRGAGEHLAGAGVGVRVGDDDAVDQLGPGGQHGGVVGGVDGLGEIAPAGQRGDAVLAEVLDGGQDVRARRQQPAVAEGAEDPGVVGGGGTQLEELPLGGGDRRRRAARAARRRTGPAPRR